jgi:hemerythrin
MEIDQFIGDLTAGQNEIPESLVGFLKTWLDKHLCVSDAGYAQYLNTRRAA